MVPIYTYNLSFNADTRSLKLESSEQFIGTAYDDNTIVLKFQINDPNGKLADMSGRVQTAVKVTDVQSHQSWCPFYPLDDFNQVIIPKELLASATSKKVPITLIYENATAGSEQQIASNEAILHLSEIPRSCPKNVRPLDFTRAFKKAKYDASTGTLEIWAFDNAKTTIKLQNVGGATHYVVNYLSELPTITNPYPGDTCMVKYNTPYGNNVWYLYVNSTLGWVAFATFFTYGKSLGVSANKIQLKDANSNVISEIDAPGGSATLNGSVVLVSPSTFKIYAPTDSGSAGQYLSPQGAMARPKWQSPDTVPTSGSNKLITSDAVYDIDQRAITKENEIVTNLNAEISRATTRENAIESAKEDAFTLGGDMEFASGRKLQTKYDFVINNQRKLHLNFYAPQSSGNNGQFLQSRGPGAEPVWIDLTGLFKYKGSVDNYSDLPATGNKTGDVWNVRNAFVKGTQKYPAGTNVAWDGTDWDPLGGTVDLSDYQKKVITGKLAKVVITDSTGTITASSLVGVEQLDYLIGCTSNIQDQLNNKTPYDESIGVWSVTRTYKMRSTVLWDHKIYESIQDNNIAHPTTDVLWWKEVSSGGGGSGGQSFFTKIGDGTNKTYTITHNLGTTYYTYNLTDDTTGMNIGASVKNIDDATVQITFASAPATNSISLTMFAGTTSRNGFYYVQTGGSAVWNVMHKLGRKVSVQTWNASGQQMFGEVKQVSDDEVQITFGKPLAGSVTIV